jgi:hypothetical protein
MLPPLGRAKLIGEATRRAAGAHPGGGLFPSTVEDS